MQSLTNCIFLYTENPASNAGLSFMKCFKISDSGLSYFFSITFDGSVNAKMHDTIYAHRQKINAGT